MAKITFMGAGSTVFVRNIVGDCMLSPVLRDSHFALYDIDGRRLKESKLVAEALNDLRAPGGRQPAGSPCRGGLRH